MKNKLVVKAKTALALGVPSLARALWYRLGLKTGLNPVRRLQAATPVGPFFSLSARPLHEKTVARKGWFSHAEAFGVRLFDLDGAAPDWLAGCLSGQPVAGAQRPWWQIADFDPAVGDIKTVWEFSRFDWVLACAQHAAQGNDEALERLNAWLVDWLQHNPPYFGPNWKCGQEASIRVMHLAMAAHILGQSHSVSGSLLDLIELHLQRIAPTLMYAVAQNNNHGTSEAAALFIGGSWLHIHGRTGGSAYMEKGRKWLENRVRLLIETDGSFSQYSLNYHRVMLDTLCMADIWRTELELPKFSARFYARAAAATDWLRLMTQPENGDAPNLGANDGARLLPLTDTDYRDYRPSVQLAAAVFHGACAYEGEAAFNQPLYWLGVGKPQKQLPAVRNAQLDKGGYCLLHRGAAMLMLRYPRFRYRPVQADALHLDLWLQGENWLRDAGSFSYNTAEPWLSYFPGTAAHNTVQFDDRDQMPRLGRFLFGSWLRAVDVHCADQGESAATAAAAYSDGWGASHNRNVQWTAAKLVVTDRVQGFKNKAVLRWRLKPGDWVLDAAERSIRLGGFVIRVASTVPVRRMELVEGAESRYYLHKTPVPVLEVEISQSGELVSTIEWVNT